MKIEAVLYVTSGVRRAVIWCGSCRSYEWVAQRCQGEEIDLRDCLLLEGAAVPGVQVLDGRLLR